MLLIIRNERMLLEMIQDTEKAFPEHLAFFMLHHLHHPERTALFHQIEERLSTTGQGINYYSANFTKFAVNVCVLLLE